MSLHETQTALQLSYFDISTAELNGRLEGSNIQTVIKISNAKSRDGIQEHYIYITTKVHISLKM